VNLLTLGDRDIANVRRDREDVLVQITHRSPSPVLVGSRLKGSIKIPEPAPSTATRPPVMRIRPGVVIIAEGLRNPTVVNHMRVVHTHITRDEMPLDERGAGPVEGAAGGA